MADKNGDARAEVREEIKVCTPIEKVLGAEEGAVAVDVREEGGEKKSGYFSNAPPAGWASENGSCALYLWRVFLFLGILGGLGGAGIVCYCVFYKHSWSSSNLALGAAVYCAGFATIATGFQIHLHITSYTNPPQQRKIIRILLMVPVYAIASAAALYWYKDPSEYIDLVRDMYEAFALYTFYNLMLDYLDGPKEAVKAIRETGMTEMHHPMPLCFLPPFQISRRTFRTWSTLVMQFVLFKPLLSIITIILRAANVVTDEDAYDPFKPSLWILVLENFSVTAAFTCIFYFYLAGKEALKEYKPTGKFVAIKIVVFLCFWQGVLIGALTNVGAIHESAGGKWTEPQVAAGLQNFFVCVEMMAICLLHKYAFPHTPYLPETGLRKGRTEARHVFDAVLDVRDVHEDSKSFFRTVKMYFRKYVFKKRDEDGNTISPNTSFSDTTRGGKTPRERAFSVEPGAKPASEKTRLMAGGDAPEGGVKYPAAASKHQDF